LFPPFCAAKETKQDKPAVNQVWHEKKTHHQNPVKKQQQETHLKVEVWVLFQGNLKYEFCIRFLFIKIK